MSVSRFDYLQATGALASSDRYGGLTSQQPLRFLLATKAKQSQAPLSPPILADLVRRSKEVSLSSSPSAPFSFSHSFTSRIPRSSRGPLQSYSPNSLLRDLREPYQVRQWGSMVMTRHPLLWPSSEGLMLMNLPSVCCWCRRIHF